MAKLFRKTKITAIILAILFIGACSPVGQIMDGDGMIQTFEYTQISQDEAKRMMAQDDGHVIVDVRRQDEYDEGHIPGAILIPNESIDLEPPAELPDFNQIILVYCRSGRRSKEASQKLADMGYSNVFEFGGIIDWTGDIDKGGSDMGSKQDDMTPMAIPVVSIGDIFITIDLESNASADEFFKKIKKEPIQIEMHDYGDFEKVGDLPWSITQTDSEITTKPGDLILYQGNQISIYYEENTWTFTRLGRLNATEEEIKEAFGGKENIIAEFYTEWTE
ncbi:cyclophilin-like fold protein [Butyrivibrio sp. MC2013]|uniref:cyclophilin-like fold protein n=1 Tax=Butyrivibrio sp. MC2013 TaxID=1280686 RepID=UPI0003FD1A47|nr:cyclophilin-like fold protein [Butyrivibrio sp. MC2013]